MREAWEGTFFAAMERLGGKVAPSARAASVPRSLVYYSAQHSESFRERLESARAPSPAEPHHGSRS